MSKDVQEKIAHFQEQLAKALSEKASLDLQVKTLRDQLGCANHESQNLQEHVAKFEKSLVVQGGEIEKLRQQMNDDRTQQDNQEETIRKQVADIEELRLALEKSESQRKQFQEKTMAQEVKVHEFQEQVKQLQAELSKRQTAPIAESVRESPKTVVESPQRLPAEFVDVLAVHVDCLKGLDLVNSPETGKKVAESLAILVQLLKKVDQTIVSQLEVLGKNHTRIKSMAETVSTQGLLSIEEAIKGVLVPKAKRMTRLVNYADLLLRWWSAVLAGVQTTVMEVPHELTEALNPAHWDVEKKRWAAEEAAFWEHFKFVIRQELPLKVGDKLKHIQADKTLEAYTIIGGGQLTGSQKQQQVAD